MSCQGKKENNIFTYSAMSQEKAYVTGLEAANLVIEQFGVGIKANIIPVEPDEPHIQGWRSLNTNILNLVQNFLPDF